MSEKKISKKKFQNDCNHWNSIVVVEWKRFVVLVGKGDDEHLETSFRARLLGCTHCEKTWLACWSKP